jgi:hypothetical protein
VNFPNAAGLAGTAANAGGANFASPIGLDRLVRQEVALGLIREIAPPEDHIGLQLFPWMEVATDDVIFHYAQGMTDGLAPARAEDAEAELKQRDDIFGGEGRASLIDWAVKDRYAPSDVSRYREWLAIAEQIRDTQNIPLTVQSMTGEFQSRLSRDAISRRRRLDNRLEWLIMTGWSSGAISYNDGKIKFSVDYGRPANQVFTHAAANIAGNSAYPIGDAWDVTTSDPIADILAIQQYMYATYGVRITRAMTSRKVLNSILTSSRFLSRMGLVVGGTPSTPLDPKYAVDGWGPTAAQAIVEQQTGVKFMEYDSVYRSRAVGSSTVTVNRFTPENQIIFFPEESEISQFDDTGLGLGRVLTSPHPAGNWSPGFYEWERELGVDPWGYEAGAGVKAFPIFPRMELTVSYAPLT